jgi:hypothetical protein
LLRYLGELPFLKQIEMVADKVAQPLIVGIPDLYLQQKTFAQVSRPNSRRVEGMNLGKNSFDSLAADTERRCTLLNAGAEITSVVNLTDYPLSDAALLLIVGR